MQCHVWPKMPLTRAWRGRSARFQTWNVSDTLQSLSLSLVSGDVRIQCQHKGQSETSRLSPLQFGRKTVWSQLIHESERWRAHSIFSGHQKQRGTGEINLPAPCQSSGGVALFKTHSKLFYHRCHDATPCFPLNKSFFRQLMTSRLTCALIREGRLKLASQNILFPAGNVQEIHICVYSVSM